jgi:hypothetical protein
MVLATLRKICAICKICQHTHWVICHRIANTLRIPIKIYQRVAHILSYPVANLPEALYLCESYPISIRRGNLSLTDLKKINFKFKKQGATENFKTIRSSCPNYALSQSRDTVPWRATCFLQKFCLKMQYLRYTNFKYGQYLSGAGG